MYAQNIHMFICINNSINVNIHMYRQKYAHVTH